MKLTGTIGTRKNGVTITGNGTTATLTTDVSAGWGLYLDDYGWSGSTTRSVQLDPSCGQYYTAAGGAGNFVTATRTGPTTFTFPSTATGTLNNPIWGFKASTGLSMYSFQGVISGLDVSIGPLTNAGIDIYNGGITGGGQCTMISCNAQTAGWNMPVGASKANFRFINCDQPTGSTTDNLGNVAGMSFANLPGQGGVQQGTAIEGMEFDIVDAQKAGPAALTGSDLGTTVIAGGSQHAKVRYNGTNWTCAGF